MPTHLTPRDRLRLAAGFLGIALFVSAVIAIHFIPRRLEVPFLMGVASFIALGGAFSASKHSPHD